MVHINRKGFSHLRSVLGWPRPPPDSGDGDFARTTNEYADDDGKRNKTMAANNLARIQRTQTGLGVPTGLHYVDLSYFGISSTASASEGRPLRASVAFRLFARAFPLLPPSSSRLHPAAQARTSTQDAEDGRQLRIPRVQPGRQPKESGRLGSSGVGRIGADAPQSRLAVDATQIGEDALFIHSAILPEISPCRTRA